MCFYIYTHTSQILGVRLDEFLQTQTPYTPHGSDTAHP